MTDTSNLEKTEVIKHSYGGLDYKVTYYSKFPTCGNRVKNRVSLVINPTDSDDPSKCMCMCAQHFNYNGFNDNPTNDFDRESKERAYKMNFVKITFTVNTTNVPIIKSSVQNRDYYNAKPINKSLLMTAANILAATKVGSNVFTIADLVVYPSYGSLHRYDNLNARMDSNEAQYVVTLTINDPRDLAKDPVWVQSLLLKMFELIMVAAAETNPDLPYIPVGERPRIDDIMERELFVRDFQREFEELDCITLNHIQAECEKLQPVEE